jgi:hypothetical protein
MRVSSPPRTVCPDHRSQRNRVYLVLVTALLDQVRRDVTSFADPGSPVEISDRVLRWTRSRVEFAAQLIRNTTGFGFPDVAINGREYNYTGFLASEALADLKDLAATMSASIAPPPRYIPVDAKLYDVEIDQASTMDASELIRKQTLDASELPLAATRVLFVHGNAGTGKTSTLLQLAKRQADLYLQGQTKTLFLYLDAQGKGLSQLEDVMARALQDIRAKFTYHSVAALTRRHCVIPIVDGFDELIGPSSAREAFANLAQFLAQLDCEGALIVSSRSAFIDYRTLHERAAELAASQNLSYEIVPVQLLPWDDAAIDRYCRERSPDSAVLRDRVFQLMGSPEGDLVRKPFFLSQISEIVLRGDTIDEQGDITGQVVNAALVREAGKLRDQRGRELITPEQHRLFCEYVADEMWSLGKPELDCDTVRLLAEVCAEEFGLEPRDAKTLIDRSIAHGLLSMVPNTQPERRTFEHELFRFEFQAGSLARLVRTNREGVRDYIHRAEIPLEVVTRIPLFGVSSTEAVSITLDMLSSIVARSPNSQFAPANAGSLAAALIRDRSDLRPGLKFHSFYMRSQKLGRARLERADIRKCLFERVDLIGTELLGCSVQDTQFIGCEIGEGTRFEGTAIEPNDFAGIVEVSGNRRLEIYDPGRIYEVLRDHDAAVPAMETAPVGEPAKSDHASARMALVERLLSHARNHFYISRQDRWYKNNLANDPEWQTVERLLRANSLLENASVVKSGKPEIFLRLTTAPDKILQARVRPDEKTQASTRKFWKDLAAG